jgi:hypothetical protein
MSIDASTFSLYALEAPTGVKFFLTGRPKMDATANAFLARVYEAYADYVLKVGGDSKVGCKPSVECRGFTVPPRSLAPPRRTHSTRPTSQSASSFSTRPSKGGCEISVWQPGDTPRPQSDTRNALPAGWRRPRGAQYYDCMLNRRMALGLEEQLIRCRLSCTAASK